MVARVLFLILTFVCACNASNAYNKLFVYYGKKHNIPAELLWGIAKTESGFNPRGRRGGAKGKTQTTKKKQHRR